MRLLRQHGLKSGDAVALVCSNRAEFIEVLDTALHQRGGWRITPVNWHLTADEIAYIVGDCEAKAVFCEQRGTASAAAVAQCPNLAVKVAIGGPIEGFLDYDAALAPLDGSDIDDPSLGNAMMYTSGTTGRPKGVYRSQPMVVPQAMYAMRGYDHETSVQLCAGPAYHAAPLAFDVRGAMGAGCELVFMDKWDSEHALRLMAEKRVSHMHLVPIMFQRLLALPDEVKARYDLSSVIYIVHGAAPCPPEVKAAMIDWFGPVLSEYYAGSEGGAGFVISLARNGLRSQAASASARPCSAPRSPTRPAMNARPASPAAFTISCAPGGGFTYFKDEAKTQKNRVGDYFTMGDVGYFDEDDYLFLTGRDAETIISGGVNIYPQEVDNELIKREAVAGRLAPSGLPHDEWGEQVKAVILLKPGFSPSDKLAQEILDFARASLPGFKVPRSVDFVTDLPRSEAGKIQRNKVRAPYWEGRARQI